MTTQNKTDNKPSPMKELKKRIIIRASLVLLTIVLTVVLVFSLTIAWQTNVVQTEGLTFSAKTWNFNGEVIIEGGSYNMAPGDSGIVSMKMNNDSDLPAAVSLTVSKSNLISQMQDKLFFYVDSSAVRNGENIEKIYLNSKNSYTYMAFPHSQLVLTESDSNGPLLKWEWVYDNLGYYVSGQSTQSSEGITSVTIEEYIRPIIYDYDEMNTTFDSNGNLLTIDGVVTVDQFISELSKTDGYEGTVNPESKTAGGYYPVEVNENGYGVWLYICNYSDIQRGAQEDTSLGNSSAALGNIRVNISGQNSLEQGTAVFEETDLIAALNNNTINMVTLYKDIQLSQSIILDSNTSNLIDLNGYKLISSAENIIDAKDGASIMLYNGSIQGSDTTVSAVQSMGASVTLNNVTISNVSEGVAVFDNKSTASIDSRIHISNCTINAKEDGLWIYGNKDQTEKQTVIIVESSHIVGENYSGIICNGTYYGTDILVKDSNVKGKYTSIYFPQKNSTLTVENSELEGYTGLVVKGGTVEVINSRITGTGEYTPLPEDPSSLSMSGWVDTGDGIYLEANYATGNTTITVSGEDTFVSSAHEKTQAVRQYPDNTVVPQASIIIKGGKYTSDVSEYLGTGFNLTQTDDGYYTVN